MQIAVTVSFIDGQETKTFEVGYFDPTWNWVCLASFVTYAEARVELHYLNGGSADTVLSEQSSNN